VKFLLDEDVAVEVARCLQQAGHEVVFVADALGRRTDDVEVWRCAARTGAIMVTCNRQDFLELAGTEPAAGLIIVNRRVTRQAECGHVLRLVANAGESGLRGNINFA
jgi:predicted nuclease of predicted toxin-antitoxin system